MQPESIPFSSVVVTDRLRSDLNGIESLADAIADVGLIQPLVLVPLPDGRFKLDAGGRRHAALSLLNTETLFHGTTSDPQRPGFILRGEEGDVLKSLFVELHENFNRQDVDWRDNVKGIARAFRLAEAQENEKGKELTGATFGAMLGVPYQDVRAALAVHDAVVSRPELFKDVYSIRGAYALLLKENAKHVDKLLASRGPARKQIVEVQVEPQPEGSPQADLTEPVSIAVSVSLTEQFLLGNSLDWMESLRQPIFDHVICDPDYAVAKDVLAAKAGADTTSAGVVQNSVEESLADLYRFLALAYHVTRPGAFCIFWYDLDHHEKLQRRAESVGWLVQRWPLIWHKTDFRGNAAPGYNFCKNIEYAMVLRKPGATLTGPQTSSVIALPGEASAKRFNHPFSKPVALWTKLFSAVAHRGQSVFDPFMGGGSSCVAALHAGLKPYGMELNPDHYYNALTNIRAAYTELVPNVEFV